jgi:endonuclease/exonuclease/phosphatase family metal-dependent hydrolase
MSFGLLTLNLWNANEPLEERYRALEAGLRLLHPDIVCLQETSRDPKSGRSQAELIAAMCNLTHCAVGDGLAVLCSGTILRSHSLALPAFRGDVPRHVLLADLLVEDRPLLVTNTHLAYPPEMIQERRKQAEAVLTAMKNHVPAERATAKILCGDFNDTADSPAIRTVMDSDEHFRDVFAECHPTSAGFTYLSQNRYVDPVWIIDERIDYIFANNGLIAKNCSVVFDGTNELDLVSDHFGVFCNLAFSEL